MKAWLALCLYGLIASTVWASALSKIVVFGDSLSDTGNSYEYTQHHIPASFAYYKGRFSNGPIWVDYIAKQWVGAQVLNYAFGGAGVLNVKGKSFTLNQEIDSYLLTHPAPADPNSLFIVWIGANDYLLHPFAQDADITRVVDAIDESLRRLAAHGARHIMVLSLPDLGRSPHAEALDLTDQLSSITQKHNQLLQKKMKIIASGLSRCSWLYVDINQLLNDMMKHPEVYGLVNTRESCYEEIPRQGAQEQQQLTKDCHSYLFFDLIHPTAAVHQRLAQQVFSQFKRSCNVD